MKKFLRNNSLSLVLAGMFVIFWGLQSWAGYLAEIKEREEHGEPATGFAAYLCSGHFWEVEDHVHDPGSPAALRKGKIVRWLYQYSLGLAFFFLFGVSFVLHAIGGYTKQRQDAEAHGKEPESFWEFTSGAEFWFQSMQNWQSEFLAVFSIVVLSIWLRHHASPESKCVWSAHSKTGKE